MARTKSSSALPDELLRAALRAYIATFPTPERLRAHLEAAGELDRHDAVRAALDAVVRDIERFMVSIDAGSHFDAERAAVLFATLRARYVFLDDACVRTLTGFAMWYAWHEGYLPPSS